MADGKWTLVNKEMFLLLLISLFIAIILEATVISLPLAFVLLLCYSILKRTGKVLISAFAAGILLDIFLIRDLGASALYLIVFFSFVLLYQRKYEIRTYPFVFISAFAGAYLYSYFFTGQSFLQGIISAVFALLIFAIGSKLKGEMR